MIKQGAEATVYKTSIFAPSLACVQKHRPRKTYRHPTLDARLTRQRLASEARVLQRCWRAGIAVPALYYSDGTRNLYFEYIHGASVRDALQGVGTTDGLMSEIGRIVAQLHEIDVVHGDLTTSNFMLDPNGRVYLIDFGLSMVSAQVEDKAVDLYVLERAFASTHPKSEGMFARVLSSYAVSPRSKAVLRRLEEVRLRGRKRSMVG